MLSKLLRWVFPFVALTSVAAATHRAPRSPLEPTKRMMSL